MMSYFGLREWEFCNKNIDELANLLKSQSKLNLKKRYIATDSYRWQNGIASINSNDYEYIGNNDINSNHDSNEKDLMSHRSLEFDMRTIDWKEYFFHYLPGIKKYFFKEPITEKCVKHVRRYFRVFLFSLLKLN